MASFSAIASEFLAAQADKLSPSRLAQIRNTFRLFKNHVADLPLESINPSQVLGFLKLLGTLHKSWSQFHGSEGLSFAELLTRYPATAGKGISRATANNYLSGLQALWTWAESNWRVAESARSPFSGRRVKSPKGEDVEPSNRPFEVSDLNKIFSACDESTMKAAMSLALYTGMRPGEVSNLTRAEIKTEGGVHFIDLRGRRADAKGGPESVKTPEARRVIPIHSDVIQAGFLDWVPSRGPVFAALKIGRNGSRANDLSNRFAKLRDLAGLPGRSVREFRNSFYAACDRAGIGLLHTQRLMGHAREKLGRTYAEGSLGPVDLAPSVAKISFEGLNLPRLYPSHKVSMVNDLPSERLDHPLLAALKQTV